MTLYVISFLRSCKIWEAWLHPVIHPIWQHVIGTVDMVLKVDAEL